MLKFNKMVEHWLEVRHVGGEAVEAELEDLQATINALTDEQREKVLGGQAPKKTSEACHETSVQDCDHCDDVECGDNTSAKVREREGCDTFSHGTPGGDCDGDGHYMCRECVSWSGERRTEAPWRVPTEPDMADRYRIWTEVDTAAFARIAEICGVPVGPTSEMVEAVERVARDRDAWKKQCDNLSEAQANTVAYANMLEVDLEASKKALKTDPVVVEQDLADKTVDAPVIEAREHMVPFESIMEVEFIKSKIDWSKYPKLADIFRRRPSENVYWHELVMFVNEMAWKRLEKRDEAWQKHNDRVEAILRVVPGANAIEKAAAAVKEIRGYEADVEKLREHMDRVADLLNGPDDDMMSSEQILEEGAKRTLQRVSELEAELAESKSATQNAVQAVRDLVKDRDELRADIDRIEKTLELDCDADDCVDAIVSKIKSFREALSKLTGVSLATADRVAVEARLPEPKTGGIYVASKTKHASMWKQLRAGGFNIISTWIDEGEVSDWRGLWQKCIDEIRRASELVLYVEPGEVLKGALVEVGAALAHGIPVRVIGSPMDQGSWWLASGVQCVEEWNGIRMAKPEPQGWKGEVSLSGGMCTAPDKRSDEPELLDLGFRMMARAAMAVCLKQAADRVCVVAPPLYKKLIAVCGGVWIDHIQILSVEAAIQAELRRAVMGGSDDVDG